MTERPGDRARSLEVQFLVGECVYLRPIEPDDMHLIRRWANDPEVRRLTGEALPMSRAGADEFLERVRQDKERVWFVVVYDWGGHSLRLCASASLRLCVEPCLFRLVRARSGMQMPVSTPDADCRG